MADYEDSVFPNTHDPSMNSETGMTMRDYFAGQSLVGILSSLPAYVSDVDTVTKDAYVLADAMIRASKEQ